MRAILTACILGTAAALPAQAETEPFAAMEDQSGEFSDTAFRKT